MDSGDDRAVFLPGHVAKHFHHGGGGEGVKTSSGFIKEDKGGVSNELNTYGGTLALTARHALNERTTNSSVLALN